MIERVYNLVTVTEAKRFVATLRRRGYKARRNKQWIYVYANSFDMELTRLAQLYRAIAY